MLMMTFTGPGFQLVELDSLFPELQNNSFDGSTVGSAAVIQNGIFFLGFYQVRDHTFQFWSYNPTQTDPTASYFVIDV